MKTKLFLCVLAIASLLSITSFGQVKKAPVKNAPVKKSTLVAPKKAEDDATSGKTKVKITTDMGVMIVKLYDATPKHRDNFIKLVSEGFYDSLLFHRIIREFMIQGGDPMSKNAEPGAMLGMGGGDMQRIPAEFNKALIHKKGALAAARDGNPEKASSACQFYIVQGKPSMEQELNMISQQSGSSYTAEQKKIYATQGGTPFLDMNYTVFGEVISGIEVVDKIAAADKNPSDRPLKDIHMKMELMK
jgi:peptidyl-prolyl cis-trans isomerase B (cyclophilin B)